MKTKKIIIICGSILVAAALIIYVIFSTEPNAQREGATRKSAMLVDVVTVKKGNYKPMIVATGMVQAVEDIILSPMVTGQITSRSASFVPGGFVKKGTVLLQIDPSDYKNTVELRKGELMETQTNLATEMGRQMIAKQDLALIGGDTLSADEEELVLRKPQLKAVKANINSAKAAVSQAQLNLSRTSIKSPFDANVISQQVSVGSQVAPGDELGRLVGADFYWVEASIPVSKLKWLQFPETEKDTGTAVTIKNSTAWLDEEHREGYLDKQIGALDDQTRLARVLVKVPDPLAKEEAHKDQPKLMIGSFVEVILEANELEDVIKLDRDYVRTNNTVWVMKNDKLEIREVKVLLSDTEYAYINEGLSNDEEVVATNLSTVAKGLDLRKRERDSLGTNSQTQ